ncbi:MAG: hypothetical protein A3G34_09650 [Candidatus Lindowbacteria bacterium RIFCSPLOWO2_12_FULL_62_27]|nr:MAG: hypothetical protein A3G34_09650 [Candidatus Lindowbacteria bacterium RIFCSPLOWO2_12_FULL_62_27]OGH61509.1 MAG: hypothetical protein A3I06_02650 [Candidatus Lindowbacteria bacterium RIFCSPLOWO2_02_FULL_62_12]
MRKHPLTLVLGGAASGKSEYAEWIAGRLGRRILYLATGLAGLPGAQTKEWHEKIRRHRARRPQTWKTVVLNGRPLDRVRTGRRPAGVLIDSLTLWVAARFQDRTTQALEEDLRALLEMLRQRAPVIVVSDEVGLGMVPVTRAGRKFSEALGRLNAGLAAQADRVLLVISGLPMQIKPRSTSKGGIP